MADPWVALAAVALRTSRIRIGTLVTPLARRRPWKLARETVTLDRLSGGRLVLGVGLGDPVEWEFGWFGEPTAPGQRAELLDESLAILAGLWTGELFSFHGKHHVLHEVRFQPRPVHGSIPIWVGGWWPHKPPLRRAARWDGMAPITSGGALTPDELGEAYAYVRDHRPAGATAFDVVVTGATEPEDREAAGTQVAEYAARGATWWVEDCSPWRFGADWESPWQPIWTRWIQDRIAVGPPRYGQRS
jgi:alkanesulfonate monooxygenase SsuD/methylene tetrahydromethanopterin reductase-like flavin-dependent oxidoreductase (luciferase family)